MKSRFWTALWTLVAAGAFAVIVAGVVAVSGIYDVSAKVQHPPPVAWFIHYVMQRSVAAHAPKGPVPDLSDKGRIVRGAAHFMSGCAGCHGAPGEAPSPLARNMLAAPPPLYSAAHDFTPNELFWIVQNGIKLTAMPGWPVDGRDDEIWDMVAFLEALPGLQTGQNFATLAGAATGATSLPQTPGTTDSAECARCHGADGMGRDGAFPKLAGLGADYIADQLKLFRDGTRPSGFMRTAAANLTDDQIAALAQYYAGLPRAPAAPAQPSADAAQGQQIYEQGIPAASVKACADCHEARDGKAARGQDLKGQPAFYTAAQLELFRSGARSSRVMERIARLLTDPQIAALAGYLQTAQ
jgi:cytochrome c553